MFQLLLCVIQILFHLVSFLARKQMRLNGFILITFFVGVFFSVDSMS